ncbi:MAG TPA: ligase-associated DNA damage response exonuclease [Gemmatales bacterium]|nr:ligase-associated DNA damage response exonuclease [Gemmatales bacterium]
MLIRLTDSGLYCEAGDFYIDPWRNVSRAIVTHAHSDHARRGSDHYLVPSDGVGVLRHRLGRDISVTALPYGESLEINGVKVSLHPAGHILGSCMVRVEHRGEVWLFSGDYKTQPDPTCRGLALVRCDVFISECTFGLPIYRWQPGEMVMEDMLRWWRKNIGEQRCSVVFAYALGKAQRILAGLDASLGPIGLHGAIHSMMPMYHEAGISFPAYEAIDTRQKEQVERFKRGGLLLAPPSANGTPWLSKFGDVATASASGWMTIRGPRRRANVETGFILSDHADWPGLLHTIQASGAKRVGLTHGYISTMVRYLQEKGLEAFPLQTQFQGDAAEE